MKPGAVESVINAVANSVYLSCDAEINLEANPTSTEVKKLRSVVASELLIAITYCNFFHCLREFKEAGITRLSLGVQVE